MNPETPSPSVTNLVIQFCKAEMVDHSASPPPEYDEAQGEAWIGGYAAAIEIVHDFASTPTANAPVADLQEALNGYRAAVAWISSDSWDGCSDCIAILRAARNADVDHPGWSNDDLAGELARIRKHSEHFRHWPTHGETNELRGSAAEEPLRDTVSGDNDGLGFREWLTFSIACARTVTDALDPKAANILESVLRRLDAQTLPESSK